MIWVKNVYPVLSRLVNRMFVKQNQIFATVVTLFMIAILRFLPRRWSAMENGGRRSRRETE